MRRSLARPPSDATMISSLRRACPGGPRATTLPFDITSRRSGTCSASSSSEVANRTASPRSAELGHQREDLGLGADVDAARRLVEQQHPRLGQQRLAEHDLLLVAAADSERDRRVRPGRLDGDVAHHRRDRVALARRRRPRPADEPPQPGQRQVLADRHRLHEPVALAVLGHEREPERDPRRRPSPSIGVAVERRPCRRPAAAGRRAPRAARCARRPSARRARRSRPRARRASRRPRPAGPGCAGRRRSSSSHAQQRRRRASACSSGNSSSWLRPTMCSTIQLEVDLGGLGLGDQARRRAGRRRGRRSRAPPRGGGRCRRSRRRPRSARG